MQYTSFGQPELCAVYHNPPMNPVKIDGMDLK
jgi:hypothetical protein